MRRLTIIAGLCAAAMLSGCISEERVVIPSTNGQVVGWSTGVPVPGAEIAAIDTGVNASSDAEGRFKLDLLKRRSSRALLPASGVFVNQAELVARTGDARAYGAAYFITISEEAEDEVVLFMVPQDAEFDATALPEDCLPNDRETYALQLLATPPAPDVRTWLNDEPGRSDNLATEIRAALVRGLAERCALGLTQKMDWVEQIDALTQNPG